MRGVGVLQRCRVPRRSSSSASRSRVRSVRATSCQPRPVSAPSSAQSRLSEAPGQCARTRRQASIAPSLRSVATLVMPASASLRADTGPRLGSAASASACVGAAASARLAAGACCRGLRARGQRALALGGVVPPGLRRRAFDEAHRRDEGVEHAGIVAHAGTAVQRVVERVRIATGELCGPSDADRAQVGGDRRADVGQVLEARHVAWLGGDSAGSRGALMTCGCLESGRPRRPRSRTVSRRGRRRSAR